jgi:hypothetical protein
VGGWKAMVLPNRKDTHMAKIKLPKKSAQKAAAMRENKTEKVLSLLRRDKGASLAEITAATSWLPHTARAMLTGFRKKGCTLDKAKVDGVTRYSVTGEPAA